MRGFPSLVFILQLDFIKLMSLSFPGRGSSSPILLFSAGWLIVLLSLLIGVGAPWNTFILGWKVEFVASIFLIGVLGYFLRNKIDPFADLTSEEIRFLILPISIFILWSAFSMLWASSWKSALHHTLVWSEYLIFYVSIRHVLRKKNSFPTLLTTSVGALSVIAVPALAAYVGILFFTGAENNVGIKFARYGEQIATILPLALAGILRLRGRSFTIGLLAITAMWLVVFCSLGRIATFLFIFIVVVAAISVFLFRRLRKYRAKFVAVTACLLAVPLLLYSLSRVAEKEQLTIVSRISDAESVESSNGFRRLMMTLSLEMLRDNPLTGVGTDNFGFAVNRYRAEYGRRFPDDPKLAIAESEIPERTHNEYLQIVSELGLVGGSIFAWFLFGIGMVALRTFQRRPRSPFPYAALLGLGAFLLSSLVTSFSFRMMQHGMIFFFVLAYVAAFAFRHRAKNETAASPSFSPTLAGARCMVGILICFCLISYSAIRAASVGMTLRAVGQTDVPAALEDYRVAMDLDSENPEPRSLLGLQMISDKRYAEAVPLLAESVRIGKATSAEMSFLATAQRLSGDLDGAERTMAHAAELYPRSTFVLTRYASILRENGKSDESDKVLARAYGIDRRTTNTWWAFINDGPRAASDKAFSSSDQYVQIMDLQPRASIYALKTERDILHPEDRLQYDLGSRIP